MKKMPLREFFDIYSKVPRLCVETVIIQNHKVLLTLRDIPPGKGIWHLPGGTVFYDESVTDAARRIAKDELGVNAEVIRFLGYIDWYKSKNALEHSVSLVFLMKIISGDIQTNFQAKEAKFFNVLPKNLFAEHKKFIEENLRSAALI